jgi:hypothetical protein
MGRQGANGRDGDKAFKVSDQFFDQFHGHSLGGDGENTKQGEKAMVAAWGNRHHLGWDNPIFIGRAKATGKAPALLHLGKFVFIIRNKTSLSDSEYH